MRVKIKSQARQEIHDAIQGLENQLPGLGAEFSAALTDAIEELRRAPEMFGFYEGGPTQLPYRRYHLKRFRRLIVYQVLTDEVLVVAVAHTSREPGYWERR